MEMTTNPSSKAWLLLSEAFQYPRPGQPAALAAGLGHLPEGEPRQLFSAFLGDVGKLPPGAWEELYTRTFDLNPAVAPYVGHQVWGESYRRGEFMAELSRAQAEAASPSGGELPDHLVPVLRYLAGVAEPLPALASALGPALERMAEALCKAEPNNPYGRLLDATLALWHESTPDRQAAQRVPKEAA